MKILSMGSIWRLEGVLTPCSPADLTPETQGELEGQGVIIDRTFSWKHSQRCSIKSFSHASRTSARSSTCQFLLVELKVRISSNTRYGFLYDSRSITSPVSVCATDYKQKAKVEEKC
ncbi:hypothetical protein KOW79_016495 [Hemibagrus wyckioides]|uniref:Uncharacterized protein n=1 Tax=Hemibagrus wyckioides TaxID=337641 RepID=A0A9D3NGZ2_9TELE|nr:hypothetical protein KOW79_016495 [Hemibagrus wyckioides]